MPVAAAERGHGKPHPSTLSSKSQELTGTEEKNDWRGKERVRHRQERYEPDGGKAGDMNPCENLHEFWHKKILIKSRHETNNETFLNCGQMTFPY